MEWEYNKATSKYKTKKYHICEKAISVNYDNTQKHAVEIVFYLPVFRAWNVSTMRRWSYYRPLSPADNHAGSSRENQASWYL